MDFTLYWLDGKREVVKGETIYDALTKSGYGSGALNALDFFTQNDTDNYFWDNVKKTWIRKQE